MSHVTFSSHALRSHPDVMSSKAARHENGMMGAVPGGLPASPSFMSSLSQSLVLSSTWQYSQSAGYSCL